MPNHTSFCIPHDHIAARLLLPVIIKPVIAANKAALNIAVSVTALWDTGAMVSAITPALRERLSLAVIDTKTVNGITGKARVDVVRVAVELPGGIQIPACDALVAGFNVSGVDFVIGMDIIGTGDFALSNAEGKTLFSFAAPPFPERLNLVEKAAATNK
jgi:hypothetical protein